MRVNAILVFLFATLFCSAQTGRQITTRNVAWAGLYGQYNFSSSLSLVADAQLRYEYTDGHWITNLIRGGVSWKLKSGIQFTAGLGFFKLYTNPNNLPPRPELRPWQEVGKKFVMNKHTLYPRFRFEQRFIRQYGVPVFEDEYSFSTYRERFRVDYTYYFNPQASRTFLLLAGEEYLVNTDKKGKSHFDQNRAQAGFGYRFNKNLTLQLAYLHLFLRKTSASFEQDHIVRLSVVVQFSKKEKPKE
jgi:hypothetical protein